MVATIDNLLYPIFVGDRLKLHTLTAFMSMIGGIIVFGSAGLVIGPVAFTVTLLLLDIWRRHNSDRGLSAADKSKPTAHDRRKKVRLRTRRPLS